MKDSQDTTEILTDTALTDPENDKFGYKNFSKDLADFLVNKVPSREFVIGIYGEWGSGKSTILYFIEHYIEQYTKHSENQPIIVRFNPWWFSGQEDLIDKFLSELEANLDEGGSFEELKDQIQKLSSILSKVPSTASGGVPVGFFAGILAKLTKSEAPPLSEVKQNIEELLRESNTHIIVLIDDIDRLTEEETQQMFRLVKSVADFPQITYVLAFDQNVVVQALGEEQKPGNGEEYLEKIIQLPQHIPIPEEGTLESFFLENLDLITERSREEEEGRWQGIYPNGIRPAIRIPRDAIRLSNSIYSQYNRIGEEVSFVDLVLVEILRVFHRPIYEHIRSNKERFVLRQTSMEIGEDRFSFVDKEIESRNKDQVKDIIKHLFPQFTSKTTKYQVRDINQYRKQKRVCHPDMYNYYFEQKIPTGEISIAEMEAIIGSISDPNLFSDKLLRLSNEKGKANRSKANTFLKRLEDQEDGIHERDIENLLQGVFEIGDELIATDPSESMLDDGNDGILLRLIWKSIKQKNRKNRHKILNNAIRNGNSVYLPIYFTMVMMQEHGEYGSEEVPDREKTLNYEQIEKLQQTIVEKIEKAAKSGRLLDAPNLHIVLKRWSDWSETDKAREWSEKTFSNTDNLLLLLKGMIQVGRTSTASETRETKYINPENLKPFIKIPFVINQIKRIDQESVDESEKAAITLFEDGVRRMKEGYDPGNFGEWSIDEKRSDSEES